MRVQIYKKATFPIIFELHKHIDNNKFTFALNSRNIFSQFVLGTVLIIATFPLVCLLV